MGTSFQYRRIDLTFKLATGVFDGSNGSDTVKMTGLRVQCEIDAPGGAQLMEARLRIFGMSQAIMNRLTVLAWQYLGVMGFMKNTVTIEVGTQDSDMAVIFQGDITNAMADYQGAPEVAFLVQATSGFVDKMAPAPSSSFPGPAPVDFIMGTLAKRIGATLENNGVTAVLTDMYLSGTNMAQIQTVAKAASIDYYYQPPVLAICPKGIPRTGTAPLVSPDTGLVGWPTLDIAGIQFSTLYNPSIIHGVRIRLETSVTPAAGDWYVYSLSHRLESETPDGAWFSHVMATEAANAVRF